MGLTEELAGITGEADVLTGRDVMAGYVTDWTGRYRGSAACVVRPASAAEVAEVIRACARRGDRATGRQYRAGGRRCAVAA
jgi:FAD/FMN-containing dehydrogenase